MPICLAIKGRLPGYFAHWIFLSVPMGFSNACLARRNAVLGDKEESLGQCPKIWGSAPLSPLSCVSVTDMLSVPRLRFLPFVRLRWKDPRVWRPFPNCSCVGWTSHTLWWFLSWLIKSQRENLELRICCNMPCRVLRPWKHNLRSTNGHLGSPRGYDWVSHPLHV